MSRAWRYRWCVIGFFVSRVNRGGMRDESEDVVVGGPALGLPVAVVGGLAYANNSPARTFTCPITGEELPCSKCCPLNDGAAKQGFTCPVTGEQLPCEKCCPLNGAKAEPKPEAKKDEARLYICPVTGEELGCPNCCPLNKSME